MSAPEVTIPAFLPFYLHLVPRNLVQERLRDHAAAVADPRFLDEILDLAWQELALLVEQHSFRALIGEFHAFREAQGLPMTTESSAALTRFTARLEDGAAEEILGTYPVLRERLTVMVNNTLDAYTEVFTAYAADRPMLREAGLLRSDDRIKRVFRTGSDPHNDNRQVYGLRLADDTRIVFKPRALLTDDFVRDLYEVAEPHLRHSLRACVPLSVTIGTHGWQQFIEPLPMRDDDQPSRYFYRFGALTALFGAIGAFDLHNENLLASGETPCVLDTETMLRPDAGKPDDNLAQTLLKQLKLSVVSTMLVPVMNPNSPIDVVMAGVGVEGDQKSALKRAVVHDQTSDAISVRWEQVTYKHQHNVPRLGDRALSCTDYFGDVLAGYLDALAVIRGDEIGKVFDKHPDMVVRVLLRSTMVYGRFVDAATHPDYLRSDEAENRVFNLLRQFPDYLSPQAAEYVRREERRSLRTGNIPYFFSRAGSTELATMTTSLPDVFRESALDFARQGVAMNAARSDVYHRFMLEECLSELAGESSPGGLWRNGVFLPTVEDGAPGSWWRRIADRITEIGIVFDDERGPQMGWLCGVGPDRGAPTVTPGIFVSFHDVGGIVTFLRRAAGRDASRQGTYRSADRGLDALLAEYGQMLALMPESVFSGAASLLLTRPGPVDPAWLTRVMDSVEERVAAGTVETDLANGPAGMLMALLSDAQAMAGQQRHIGRLVELLRAHLTREHTRPWFDVAHGELGLRWAAARAGRVLGDKDLADQAADWLIRRMAEDERSPHKGWCKGTAGLLLAAAEIVTSAGREEWLSGKILADLVDEATGLPEGPVDLSVCHGSSGVVQSLIATANILGESFLLDRARDYQRRVIDKSRRDGFYTGAAGRTSLLGYMLGWAGVGDTDLLLSAGDENLSVPVALSR